MTDGEVRRDFDTGSESASPVCYSSRSPSPRPRKKKRRSVSSERSHKSSSSSSEETRSRSRSWSQSVEFLGAKSGKRSTKSVRRTVENLESNSPERKKARSPSASATLNNKESSVKRSSKKSRRKRHLKSSKRKDRSTKKPKKESSSKTSIKQETNQPKTKIESVSMVCPPIKPEFAPKPELSLLSEQKFGEAYYVMRSNSEENIRVSMDKGIWATQGRNEGILNKAFDTHNRVLLVFSICHSGHFQGYAEMRTKISKEKSDLWDRGTTSKGPHKRRKFGSKWGGVFKVGWRAIVDLPFMRTDHLRNPLNENKPVKHSRDGQQLPPKLGAALCLLMDQDGYQKGFGTVVLRQQATLMTGQIAKPKFIHNGKFVTHLPQNVEPYVPSIPRQQVCKPENNNPPSLQVTLIDRSIPPQGPAVYQPPRVLRGGGYPTYGNRGYADPEPVVRYVDPLPTTFPYDTRLMPYPLPLPRREERKRRTKGHSRHKRKKKRRGRSRSRSKKRRKKKRRRCRSVDHSSDLEESDDSEERTRRCLALLLQNNLSRHMLRQAAKLPAGNHGNVY